MAQDWQGRKRTRMESAASARRAFSDLEHQRSSSLGKIASIGSISSVLLMLPPMAMPSAPTADFP